MLLLLLVLVRLSMILLFRTTACDIGLLGLKSPKGFTPAIAFWFPPNDLILLVALGPVSPVASLPDVPDRGRPATTLPLPVISAMRAITAAAAAASAAAASAALPVCVVPPASTERGMPMRAAKRAAAVSLEPKLDPMLLTLLDLVPGLSSPKCALGPPPLFRPSPPPPPAPAPAALAPPAPSLRGGGVAEPPSEREPAVADSLGMLDMVTAPSVEPRRFPPVPFPPSSPPLMVTVACLSERAGAHRVGMHRIVASSIAGPAWSGHAARNKRRGWFQCWPRLGGPVRGANRRQGHRTTTAVGPNARYSLLSSKAQAHVHVMHRLFHDRPARAGRAHRRIDTYTAWPRHEEGARFLVWGGMEGTVRSGTRPTLKRSQKRLAHGARVSPDDRAVPHRHQPSALARSEYPNSTPPARTDHTSRSTEKLLVVTIAFAFRPRRRTSDILPNHVTPPLRRGLGANARTSCGIRERSSRDLGPRTKRPNMVRFSLNSQAEPCVQKVSCHPSGSNDKHV